MQPHANEGAESRHNQGADDKKGRRLMLSIPQAIKLDSMIESPEQTADESKGVKSARDEHHRY